MGIPSDRGKDSALPRRTFRRGRPRQISELASGPIGQLWPDHWPTPEAAAECPNALGRPLNIRQVATLLGCSVWTVRQRWMPKGLPHLRSGPTSRITFFEAEVIRWLKRQQGGMAR